ncbi:MAG: nitroreductase family deazaflavin-dependent oxidoreductase [Nitriliruptoraceae bacterium]
MEHRRAKLSVEGRRLLAARRRARDTVLSRPKAIPMPMPNWWRTINKHVFNPPELRRGARPVLMHVGRRSGTTYRTPLEAHRVADGVVFVLVYGRRSDWARNVLAAGRAHLTIDGTTLELTRPRIVRAEDVWSELGDVPRPPKLLRITECLRADVVT